MKLSHLNFKQLNLLNIVFLQHFNSLPQSLNQAIYISALRIIRVFEFGDISIQSPDLISLWHAQGWKLIDLTFQALSFIFCDVF